MKETLVLAIMATLLLLAAPAVGSVEHRTGSTCGTDGYDVCINFTGDQYLLFLTDPNWAYIQIWAHLSEVYPGTVEEHISIVHDNGPCNSCDFATRIYVEMLMHIFIGDGDVHYSKNYITRACQETGDCPPLNRID